uniref:FERM domain-containing protein n=1 Tax=Parastrongyloides trichosuri TaxID=131310 RepID=A0A0N4Z3A6_PARTI
MADESKVSLAELLEVRGTGLEVDELLDITLVATEYLIKKRPLPNCKAQLFGVDELNLLKDGSVEISLIPANQADDVIIPPEIKDPQNPGKVVGNNTDAAFVWCLGTLLMNSGAADCKDANLFSLLNLLTVSDVGTRPSLKKLSQMVKNKMERGRNVKQNLQELYAEIMGDDDELNEMSDVDDISDRDLFSDEEGGERDDDNESGSHLFDYTEDVNHENNNKITTKEVSPTKDKKEMSNNPFNDNFFEARNSPKQNNPFEIPELKKESVDPFDYVDNAKQEEHNMHTLSGRDPFADIEKESSDSSVEHIEKIPTVRNTGFGRRLSDEDDIVQANLAFETPSPISSPLSTTDDLGYESPKSNNEFQNKNEPIKLNINNETSNPFDASYEASDLSSERNDFKTNETFKNELGTKKYSFEEAPIAPQRAPRKDNPFNENENEKKYDDKKNSEDNSPFKSSFITPPVVSARTRSVDYYKSQHVDAEVVVKKSSDVSNVSEKERVVSGTVTSKRFHQNPTNVKKEEDSIDEMFAKARQEQKLSSNSKISLQNDGVLPLDEADHTLGTLKRRNSMALASIRRHNQKFNTMGYGSMRKKLNKTAAVPEFIEKNSMPHIHLNAQMTKKKKLLTLYKVENTDVKVKLLNGQYIDVKCKSDVKCDEIFNLVVAHANIHEYHFFGLAIQKENEFYFLDPKKKIEKYAPSGWKNEKKATTRQPYILHMRFMRYPPMLSYVKTDVTMHLLYLQLRNDILTERLKTNDVVIFQLASLALQAEFSDKPDPSVSSPTDYFLLDHYLPKTCFVYEDSKRIALQLSQMHEQLKGMKCHEAEIRYIKVCQTLPEYGSHFYRIFKSKPTAELLANIPTRDFEAGSVHLIAIMLKGICIYEISNNERNMIQEFLWKDTNTLQFDRKRFVIVKSNSFGAQHFVFYTDHYTKSSYFVRFAAVQHKFIIRVRQWQSTLTKKVDEKPGEHGVDVAAPPDDAHVVEELLNGPSTHLNDKSNHINMQLSSPLYDIPENQNIRGQTLLSKGSETLEAPGNSRRTNEYNQNDQENMKYDTNGYQSNDKIEKERKISKQQSIDYNDFGEEQKMQALDLRLEKDPRAGLGLTLVDGKLNGVKGVYVKSVALGGAGERAGICVGDRLMSVNGISLVGKDRHDAVSYVKESNVYVELGILRFENLSTKYGKAITTLGRPQRKDSNLDSLSLSSNVIRHNSLLSADPNNTKEGKTPPTKKKTTNPPVFQKRVRAVSDFGAKSDSLPMFNTEDIINELQRNTKNPSRLDLHMDSSDEEFGTGEYQVPASSMYKYRDSDNDDDDENLDKFHTSQNHLSNGVYSKNKKGNHLDSEQFDNKSWSSNHIPKAIARSNEHSNNSDLINGNVQNSNVINDDDNDDREMLNKKIKELTIYIKRSASGSLGLKIATGIDGAYIKQVNAEPALSSGIHANDKLISINNIHVQGMTHSDIIGLLRDGGENVAIKVLRDLSEADEEEFVVVYLLKKDSIPLGLSLSKKTDSEGAFIRHIAEGSTASIEQSLKIGDRIWQVNDIFVGNDTPNNVAEMLKSSSQDLKITIKRKLDHLSNINNF